MKPHICLIILLAVTTAGCTASNKTAANRSKSIVAPNPTAMPSELPDDGLDFFDEDPNMPSIAEVKISDPLRGLNRAIFRFNDKLYLWILDPSAKAYKKTIPSPARKGIRNFFSNLTTPVRFISCHLQGKHKAAGKELHRFAYNTTFGVLGFGDPAKDKLGLELTEEDLGQTMAKWGVGNGIYIVLPLFGPSSARDTVGLVGGEFLNPVRYVKPTEASIAISATKYVNESSFHIGEYELIVDDAYDPYIALREAYIQYRLKKIKE